jgi:hypothetical protein
MSTPVVRIRPRREDPHAVVYFRRHPDEPFRTTLSERDYAAVRALGAEYLARNPRSIV